MAREVRVYSPYLHSPVTSKCCDPVTLGTILRSVPSLQLFPKIKIKVSLLGRSSRTIFLVSIVRRPSPEGEQVAGLKHELPSTTGPSRRIRTDDTGSVRGCVRGCVRGARYRNQFCQRTDCLREMRRRKGASRLPRGFSPGPCLSPLRLLSMVLLNLWFPRDAAQAAPAQTGCGSSTAQRETPLGQRKSFDNRRTAQLESAQSSSFCRQFNAPV